MAAPIVFTNAEAAAIHQRLVDGGSGRQVACWFQEKYGKSVSHTTVLSVGRRVQAEQRETEAVFDDAAEAALSDGERLSAAILRLRRLEAKAQKQRPDRLGPSRLALRALDLQIRALRFKMAFQPKEEPAKAPPTSFPDTILPSFPAGVIAPETPEIPPEIELSNGLSNGLSSEPSSEPSISIVDDVPDAPAQARPQVVEDCSEQPSADQPDDIPYDELSARDRLKRLNARMKEILAGVGARASWTPPPVAPPAPPAKAIAVPPSPPIEHAQRSYPLSELIHPGWPGAPRP